MRAGTKTLLFSDIEGSTGLLRALGDAWPAALQRHREVIRAAIARHRGEEQGTDGDSFFVVFDGVADACAAALEVQRALAQEAWPEEHPLRVRIGLHSGEVIATDDGLVGMAIHQGARIGAAGHGGQIVVSEATKVLAEDSLPEGATLRSLGPHQFKDFERPLVLYQLSGRGAETDFPALRPPRPSRGGSMPPVDDELVGRHRELAEVVHRLSAQRLVTIVGVGGMGKSRLALEAALAAGSRFSDGAWWCDLTAATSSDAVAAVALGAVEGRQLPGRSALESVTDRLGDNEALVVLDNCEHVLEAAREVVVAIRTRCPDVRLVCTSREALGLPGEHALPLSSLPHSDSAVLFVARAGDVRPDLPFDDPATQASVGEICRRLDGIPLAIELAAARCRSLSPAEIAARLGERFRLLRGGRGAVERHRTLHAAVAWSYSLLENEEREVFDRMAVFAGGATLDAVAGICGMDDFDALDVLDRLAARSMIVVADTPLGTRYRQLETLRQFAEDRLVETGVIAAVRDAHLRWAVDLARGIDASAYTLDELSSFHLFLSEIDNLRSAVAYAASTDRVEAQLRVLAGVGGRARNRPSPEVLDWVDEATLARGSDPDLVAVATGLLAYLAVTSGDLARATRLAAAMPPSGWMSAAVNKAWVLTLAAGDLDAAEQVVRATPKTRRADEWMSRGVLLQIQNIRWRRQSPPVDDPAVRAAVADAADLVEAMRSTGGQISLAVSLVGLGQLHLHQSDVDSALACATEAVSLTDDTGAYGVLDHARHTVLVALSRRGATDPEDRRTTSLLIRDLLTEAVTHRARFVLAMQLREVVPAFLWSTGHHRAAWTVSRVAGRVWKEGSNPLPPDAAEVLGAAVLAEIEAEVLNIDLLGAAALAVACLEQPQDVVASGGVVGEGV